MAYSGEYKPRAISITVAGGVGERAFKAYGNCTGFSVVPPDDAAIYDAEIIWDSNEELIAGRPGNQGSTKVTEPFRLYEGMTGHITNATVDGVYLITPWFEDR